MPELNILAVIPDCPGSARIISAAEAAKTVNRVIVSSMAASTNGGAALIRLLDNQESEPDLVVILPDTSRPPRARDIDGTVRALLAHGADSALTVSPPRPPDWEETGEVDLHRAESAYVETGAVYAVRVPALREAGHRYAGRTAFYVTQTRLREPGLPDHVEAVVLDFDGVFTDNRVLVLEDGTEGVLCNRSDGLGLEVLRRSKIPVVVISKERNPVVAARCEKLGIDCRQGIDEKTAEMLRWLADHGASAENTIYVGNDVNDLGCMEIVGWPVAVADAYPAVKAVARIVLRRPGGQGALRELVERIGVTKR